MKLANYIDEDFLIEKEYDEFISFIDNCTYINEKMINEAFGAIKERLSFIKDLASTIGAQFSNLIQLFKIKDIYTFFSKIGWSFKKLYDLVKKGFSLANDLADAIAEYIAKTGIGKWTEEKLRELDEFLKNHPKTKRITGVAVAAIIAYIWFNMTFTGNWEYDFDMSDLVAALAGQFSLSSVFAGKDGIKLLMLFSTGLAGLSFPWPGPNTIKFICSVLFAAAREYNVPRTLKDTLAKGMRK